VDPYDSGITPVRRIYGPNRWHRTTTTGSMAKTPRTNTLENEHPWPNRATPMRIPPRDDRHHHLGRKHDQNRWHSRTAITGSTEKIPNQHAQARAPPAKKGHPNRWGHQRDDRHHHPGRRHDQNRWHSRTAITGSTEKIPNQHAQARATPAKEGHSNRCGHQHEMTDIPQS
jgi:ubiquitin